MGLPTSRLGRSDLHITRVGFGSWAVGGGGWRFGWGPQDDAVSLATMRHALDLGVNWIDTAAVYGLGHSEEVVGRLLRELSPAARPLVFTKCGLVWDEADRMTAPRRVLNPESIRRECEASLRRLGVERIDLYQFHWPDETGTALEDSWAAMARLVEEGKVRAIGVSNFDAALLDRCEAIRHVDSLQPPFFDDQPHRRQARAPVVCGARVGCHRVQPDAVGPADREFHGRPPRVAGGGRLAAALAGLSVPASRPESAVAGRAPAGRGPAPRVRVRHRHRLDPRLAGRDRGDRGCPNSAAGGRLDRSRFDHARAVGSRGDRLGDPPDQGRGRTGRTQEAARSTSEGRMSTSLGRPR